MMGSTKIYKRIFLFTLIILVIYLPSVHAKDYYADITIDVDSSGYVTIDGNTGYPGLLIKDTQIYTSKSQSYWVLNITKEEVFNDFFYILTLPEGSYINYIRSSGFIKIGENQGNLVVTGWGVNESLSIQVQYQIEKLSDKSITSMILDNTILTVLLIAIIVVLIIMLIGIFVIDRKTKTKDITPKEKGVEYNFKGLNERQRQIMQLLIERKTPLTQTDIQRELNMPRSAVSRNIHGLERKGLIEKEQFGVSNLIRLKKI